MRCPLLEPMPELKCSSTPHLLRSSYLDHRLRRADTCSGHLHGRYMSVGDRGHTLSLYAHCRPASRSNLQPGPTVPQQGGWEVTYRSLPCTLMWVQQGRHQPQLRPHRTCWPICLLCALYEQYRSPGVGPPKSLRTGPDPSPLSVSVSGYTHIEPALSPRPTQAVNLKDPRC